MADDANRSLGVLDRLAGSDAEVAELFRSYFSGEPSDAVSRGVLVQHIVERCTALDATREELVHNLVHDAGEEDAANELDRRVLERRTLLHEIYSKIRNVAPHDRLLSDPEGIDALVRALFEHRREDLSFERDTIAHLAADPLGAVRVAEIGEKVEEVLDRAPVHPTSRRLAHERGPIGARVHALTDKLRDHPDSGDPDPAPPDA